MRGTEMPSSGNEERGLREVELTNEQRRDIMQTLEHLKDARRYYERNPSVPHAAERIAETEILINRIVQFYDGKLKVHLSKLARYVKTWEKRAETLRSQDPHVKEFKDVVKIQQYNPSTVDLPLKGEAYVEWGLKMRKSAPKDTLMITAGMGPCCSLAIVDDANETQTLAHIYPQDPGTKEFDIYSGQSNMLSEIRSIVSQLSNAKNQVRYYVVEGSSRDHDSAFRIYASLRAAGIPRERISFIPARSERENPNSENIVLYRGQILRASERMIHTASLHYYMGLLKKEAGQHQVLVDRLLAREWPHFWPQILREFQSYEKATRQVTTGGRKQVISDFIDFRLKLQNLENRIMQDPALQKAIPDAKQRSNALCWYSLCIKKMLWLNSEKYFG